MGLWAEIKQRRITRTVVAYLAGGWVALAVVDQFVDREILPLVAYQVALVIFAFGIAIALVLGWYHGEKGEQKATAFELALLSVITIAALGMSTLVVRSAIQADTLADVLADSSMDLRRIGVLYFEDLSAEGSNTAVADGITEGLIRMLTLVPELDVVSRNGSQRVRGLDVGPDSIARILDVGTIVDGNVDQDGDELRVTVRVLEGESGVPLFRDTYSWPLDDVALVSSELAQEVANALREQLGIEVRLRQGRSRAPNSAAWLLVARAEKLFKDANAFVVHGDAAGALDAFARADSELGDAQQVAPEWTEPTVLRGQIAYERHWLAHDIPDAAALLDEAGTYAEQALSLEPNSAAALELRGTVRYRRWLLRLDHDPGALERTLSSAREDLEMAHRLDASRASSYSTLSHLYYQVGDLAEAVMAARTAYQRDAFLSVADGVLWRLYSASYDLENYPQARQWCAEGRRRFPDIYRFTECQIWLMTMAGVEPDIDEAWRLLDQLRPLLPEAAGPSLEAGVQIVVGGIIGRAGLPDSARVVMERARLGPQDDPERELLSIEAAMYALMDDVEGAVELLGRYVTANPGHFGRDQGLHWWWRALQGNPDFENLRSLN